MQRDKNNLDLYRQTLKEYNRCMFNKFKVKPKHGCMVIVAAIISGKPMDEVIDIALKYGFNKKGEFHTNSENKGFINLFSELGVQLDLDYGVFYSGKTIKTFKPRFNWQEYVIIVGSENNGHIAAYTNGKVEDYDTNSLRRIRSAYFITKKKGE